MLHVNDDIDDLFRQAADGYPLKTDSDDWNKVSDLIPGNTSRSFLKKGKNLLLLLLLLLPLAYLSTQYFFKTKRSDHTLVQQNSGSPQKTTAVANEAKDVPVFTGNDKPSGITKNSKDQVQLSNNTQHSKSKHPEKISHLKISVQTPEISISNNKEEKNNYKKEDNMNTAAESKPVSQNNLQQDTLAVVQKAVIEPGKSSSTDGKKIDMAINHPEDKKPALNETKKQESTENKTGKQTKKSQGSKPFIYAGIMGGLDISTVKMQNIFNTGFQGGVLIGYSLNNRLSIETGLSLDKKYYYTDGKYFNSKVVYLQGTATLVDVKGNCYMLDVPVNIKYNFVIDGKTKWFSIAGVSSYFMKKQSYRYNIVYNTYQYPKYADYSAASSSLFAVINLGAGLEGELGKKISFRIEPYLKIPLKGIGVGNLSITSAGVNAGIVKKFGD